MGDGVIYQDPRTWALIVAAACVFVGLFVFRVHGLPRPLGGRRAPRPAETEAEEGGLRWLDQYSFIGLGLMALGLVLAAAALAMR